MDMRTFLHTVTLYNHLVVDGQDTWKRTVLKNVFWRPEAVRTIDSSGKLLISQGVDITVPFRKGYVEPSEYTGTGFTFGLKDLDLIAYGEHTEEITEDNFEEFARKENFVTVVKVDDYTNVHHLPLWRVMCQ